MSTKLRGERSRTHKAQHVQPAPAPQEDRTHRAGIEVCRELFTIQSGAGDHQLQWLGPAGASGVTCEMSHILLATCQQRRLRTIECSCVEQAEQLLNCLCKSTAWQPPSRRHHGTYAYYGYKHSTHISGHTRTPATSNKATVPTQVSATIQFMMLTLT